MSDENQNDQTPVSKKPTHYAYHVSKSKDGTKSYWTKIGIASAHKDGKGFNVFTDMVPLDGQISVRIASEKK